jgi:hypothetical protein
MSLCRAILETCHLMSYLAIGSILMGGGGSILMGGGGGTNPIQSPETEI